MFFWSTVLAVVLAAASDAGAAYPRAELLVEPAQLAEAIQRSEGPRWVVLDARGVSVPEKGHIPGARFINLMEWTRGFGDGTDTAAWQERLGKLGLLPDQTIVVYDGGTVTDAARAWWILRYWGFNDVRLLNGGWPAWTKAELPVTVGSQPAVRASTPNLVPAKRLLITKADLLGWTQAFNPPKQIVDARSAAEHCGTQKLAQRAGAIPHATHLDWADLLDPQTKRFKPAADLAKIFAQANVKLDNELATHCQSGGRSSVMHFALELMGAKNVRNYYRGWSEWGNDPATPITPGKPKD